MLVHPNTQQAHLQKPAYKLCDEAHHTCSVLIYYVMQAVAAMDGKAPMPTLSPQVSYLVCGLSPLCMAAAV